MTHDHDYDETEFAELRAEAAKLPVLRPTRDLWDGIAARIEAPAISIAERTAPSWWSPMRLATAAAALVTATAGLTWELASRQAVPVVAVGVPEGDVTLTSGTASPVVRLSGTYEQEIAELRAIVAQSTVPLDSATVRVIDENLRVIDAAIAASQAALAADPASALLSLKLAGAYDMKLDLLRRVAALTDIS